MCTIYRDQYSPCYDPDHPEKVEKKNPTFVDLLNEHDEEDEPEPTTLGTDPHGLSTFNGQITPIEDPADPPNQQPAEPHQSEPPPTKGKNPANDSPDGKLEYEVQKGDTLQSIAKEHGYRKNDLLLLKPELRDDPDGLPEFRNTPNGVERNTVTILSDERLKRVKSMVKLVGDSPSLDAMSQKDRKALQNLIALDVGEGAVGRGFDPKKLQGALAERQNDLARILPQAEGLSGLIDQTAAGFKTYLNGEPGKPGLFASLNEPSAALGGLNPIEHGIKTNDWSHLQSAAANKLRNLLKSVPTNRQDAAASKLFTELLHYGPQSEGFRRALIGNNDRSGALYQVMVKDPAAEIRNAHATANAQNHGGRQDVASALAAAQRLEQLTKGMSAQRTDQLLRELGMPPDGPQAGASWDPAMKGPHPKSVLAAVTGLLGDPKRTEGGDHEKTLKTIISHLNTVATQASGARYIGADGKPIAGSPAGLKTLAAGLADALPSRDAPGNQLSLPEAPVLFHKAMIENIGEGNAAALPAAMLEHYMANGQQRDAQAMAKTLRDGTTAFIKNARSTTTEYGKLIIGDVNHIGGQLKGWKPDATLQQQLDALGQGKRQKNAQLINEFKNYLAGGLVLDAALTNLSPQSKQLLGNSPKDLITLLEGAPGKPNAPEQSMLRTAFGDTFNGLGNTTDVPLAQLEAALKESDGFDAFTRRYGELSDERFDDTFGSILDTYGKIQAALKDPTNPPEGLPPLPADIKALPKGIQEILTSLEGKDTQEKLAALKDNPARGALLSEYLGMLDNAPTPNGSPRPPSGYFLAREIKNTLATLGGASLERGQPVPHVDLRGGQTTSRPGMFTQPGSAIPLSLANVVGGGLGVEEFAALGRFQGDGPPRADNMAWAYIFGGLAGHGGVQLSGGAGQLLVGSQPWQFAVGSNFDRFSGAAMRGQLPGMTVASRFLNVATAGVAYWTLGEEIADRDWPEAGAWVAVASGATMTGYASLGLAASGPVGWIGTGLWLGGAYAVTKIGGHRARTYHEPDMRTVLSGLGVSDERASILAAGRDGGLYSPDAGTSSFPLLKQLAEYRGIDVNDGAEFKKFSDMILYDEQSLPNEKLKILIEQGKKIRWMGNQGRYLQNADVRHNMHPSKHDAFQSVEDLNRWVVQLNIPLPGQTPP